MGSLRLISAVRAAKEAATYCVRFAVRTNAQHPEAAVAEIPHNIINCMDFFSYFSIFLFSGSPLGAHERTYRREGKSRRALPRTGSLRHAVYLVAMRRKCFRRSFGGNHAAARFPGCTILVAMFVAAPIPATFPEMGCERKGRARH